MKKKFFIELAIKIGLGILTFLIIVLLLYVFFYHRHSYGDWQMIRETSCAKEGVEQRACSCGATENRYIAKLAHTEGEWVLDLEAKEKSLVCSVCQTVIKCEPISEHVHSFGEWVTESDATCTSTGLVVRTCECGAREENILAVLDHVFGDWEITSEPSCEETGTKTRTCECGKTQDETLPSLDHVEGEWIYNNSMDAKNYPCERCGEILRTEEIIFSKGLEIENGIVLGIGTCTDTEIIIPFMHDGVLITEIAEKAFYKQKSIERVTVPPSLTKIGSQAFWQCSSLRYVNLENVTEIGDRAFAHCTSLDRVSINININKLEMSAFECCSSLSSIIFNGTVEQWSAIPKNEYWDEYTGEYTVYCSNGKIIKER